MEEVAKHCKLVDWILRENEEDISRCTMQCEETYSYISYYIHLPCNPSEALEIKSK